MKDQTIFNAGDKVGYSDELLDSLNGSREFNSKVCLLVTDVFEDRIYLHCGTFLYKHEAKVLPKDTPIFT